MDTNFNIFMNKTNQEEVNVELPLFCEYAINFETGQPIEENNEIVILKKNEALKVWIFRALKTELNTYKIHSGNYGSELLEEIGTIYNESIKQTILTEKIKTCLLVNPYILDVYNFSFEKTDPGVKIKFHVSTIYGTLEQEGIKIEY